MAICESAYWSLHAAIDEARAKQEPATGGATPRLAHGIRLRNIGFRYRDAWILRDLSLTIPAGAFVSLVGPSGAGKTTVIDLVTALLEPEEGGIFVDRLPLREINRKAWRRLIGYVPQDTFLLHDTILNNVTLGDPELTEEDARQALESAQIGEFVASLPEGMQSIVGERGSMLSGGQRQRVAIARALAHRPRLLILDEATSALDPASESAISKTLADLRGRLTILAVSHQSALVDVADRVYRLQDGEAVLVAEPAVKRSAAAP
jgi:ATP-binding cassette subfamily C protein